MLKMAVLISGGGTNLQAIIDNIENGNIDGSIELVVSNKKDAYGLERASKHGIENIFLDIKDYENNEKYDEKIIGLLEEKKVGLVVLAGYLKVLSEKFTRKYKNRIINVHPSLIPSFCGKGYYGEKVHKAVLDYGVKYTGATVHFVDEGTDTGAIIAQDVVKVQSDDSVESLQKRVLEKEHDLLVTTIKNLADKKVYIDGRKVEIK